MEVPNDDTPVVGEKIAAAAGSESEQIHAYPPLPEPGLKGDVQGPEVGAYLRRRITEEQFDAFCIDC